MLKVDALEIYKTVRDKRTKYDEEKHCAMIIRTMSNHNKGTVSSFCVEAGISENTFYNWMKNHEIFQECYGLSKMMARENWEEEGREIGREVNMPGTHSHKFEYWRMIGWSRYGVGKNSRIRLNLDTTESPNKHYEQLLKQAANGDFTAGEIKQLMEAVNVGLNAHQVFMLQEEINQLKSDLATMSENANGDNNFAAKGITQKD